MSDSLERLLNRNKSVIPNAEPAEEFGSDEDQCPAFGFLRGVRDRALMIEFRFANGNSHALPYSWLGSAIYNPSAGILLKFVGENVTLVLIEGSNLNVLVGGAVNLYDRGILRNRISWIREMTRQQAERTRKEEVVIDRIRMVSHRSDEEPKAEWLEMFSIKSKCSNN